MKLFFHGFSLIVARKKIVTFVNKNRPSYDDFMAFTVVMHGHRLTIYLHLQTETIPNEVLYQISEKLFLLINFVLKIFDNAVS